MIFVLSFIFVLLFAITYRLGGYINTQIRRIGCPSLLLVYLVTTCKFSVLHLVLSIASSAALFGITTLPITLIGSEIKDNLWWVPILGLLYGATTAVVYFYNIPAVIVGLIVYTIVYTSSVYASIWIKKYVWEYHELLFGAFYAFGVAVLTHLT